MQNRKNLLEVDAGQVSQVDMYLHEDACTYDRKRRLLLFQHSLAHLMLFFIPNQTRCCSVIVAARDDLLARRPQQNRVLVLRRVAALDVHQRRVGANDVLVAQVLERHQVLGLACEIRQSNQAAMKTRGLRSTMHMINISIGKQKCRLSLNPIWFSIY